MLVDSSSIINLKSIGLDNCLKELAAVAQVIEEICEIEVHQVHEDILRINAILPSLAISVFIAFTQI